MSWFSRTASEILFNIARQSKLKLSPAQQIEFEDILERSVSLQTQSSLVCFFVTLVYLSRMRQCPIYSVPKSSQDLFRLFFIAYNAAASLYGVDHSPPKLSCIPSVLDSTLDGLKAAIDRFANHDTVDKQVDESDIECLLSQFIKTVLSVDEYHGVMLNYYVLFNKTSSCIDYLQALSTPQEALSAISWKETITCTSAMFATTHNDNVELVSHFLTLGVDCLAVGVNNQAPFFYALQKPCLAVLKVMLNHPKFEVSIWPVLNLLVCEHEVTLLERVCVHLERTKRLRYLNQRCNGQYLLHQATNHDCPELVRTLMDYGANHLLTNVDQNTALAEALENESYYAACCIAHHFRFRGQVQYLEMFYAEITPQWLARIDPIVVMMLEANYEGLIACLTLLSMKELNEEPYQFDLAYLLRPRIVQQLIAFSRTEGMAGGAFYLNLLYDIRTNSNTSALTCLFRQDYGRVFTPQRNNLDELRKVLRQELLRRLQAPNAVHLITPRDCQETPERSQSPAQLSGPG